MLLFATKVAWWRTGAGEGIERVDGTYAGGEIRLSASRRLVRERSIISEVGAGGAAPFRGGGVQAEGPREALSRVRQQSRLKSLGGTASDRNHGVLSYY